MNIFHIIGMLILVSTLITNRFIRPLSDRTAIALYLVAILMLIIGIIKMKNLL